MNIAERIKAHTRITRVVEITDIGTVWYGQVGDGMPSTYDTVISNVLQARRA